MSDLHLVATLRTRPRAVKRSDLVDIEIGDRHRRVKKFAVLVAALYFVDHGTSSNSALSAGYGYPLRVLLFGFARHLVIGLRERSVLKCRHGDWDIASLAQLRVPVANGVCQE